MEQRETIAVLGAGYVGLTTAAILANSGYRIYLVEPNNERLNIIRNGKSFFYEQGLDNLISQGLETGNLIPTDNIRKRSQTASISSPAWAHRTTRMAAPISPTYLMQLTNLLS